ncbi:hypothetical protein HELRODRAFT_184523 [Helobdella robusta]|uniref:Ig-like domain-containing protein n=1 Tax=Helobdella robusta TaxID=6412 RepID=T1FLE2_HELRO|nr:hypothetical protein HELRODRAFT_184523 [Helobdella robusta]ESN91888.1 hypothetical protein HELRODRAFT_184523 [Helobdella robusta]
MEKDKDNILIRKLSVPPTILGPSPSKEIIVVHEGANLTIACNATGSPQPEITWSRVPPTILGPSPSKEIIVVHEGANLTIACNATGSPQPEITWSRRSLLLPEVNNDDVIGGGLAADQEEEERCAGLGEFGFLGHLFLTVT